MRFHYILILVHFRFRDHVHVMLIRVHVILIRAQAQKNSIQKSARPLLTGFCYTASIFRLLMPVQESNVVGSQAVGLECEWLGTNP